MNPLLAGLERKPYDLPFGEDDFEAKRGRTRQWDDFVDDYARRHGADLPDLPNLARAVMMRESGGRPDAVSPAGAAGLMQIMPDTFTEMGGRDPNDRFLAEESLDKGIRYLAEQYRRFGDVEQALAAYNAGPGNVRKHGGIPPFRETQDYVRAVMGYYGALGRQGAPPAAESPLLAGLARRTENPLLAGLPKVAPVAAPEGTLAATFEPGSLTQDPSYFAPLDPGKALRERMGTEPTLATRIAQERGTVGKPPVSQAPDEPEDTRSVGEKVGDFASGVPKGFSQALTAGLGEVDVSRGEQAGALTGDVLGTLLVGLGLGASGPVGWAGLGGYGMVREGAALRDQGRDLTDPEALAQAGTSGAVQALTLPLPVSIGRGVVARTGTGAILGAGAEAVEEAARQMQERGAVNLHDPNMLTAAILGGAFGAGFGAAFRGSPQVQAEVQQRVTPQQWEAIRRSMAEPGMAEGGSARPVDEVMADPAPAAPAPKPAPAPRREPTTRERYLQGLVKAGLPPEQIDAGMRIVEGAPVENLFDQVEIDARPAPWAPSQPTARAGEPEVLHVGDEAAKALLDPQSRGQVLLIHPDDVKTLGLYRGEALNPQPMTAKEMWDILGRPVKVSPNARTLAGIAEALNLRIGDEGRRAAVEGGQAPFRFVGADAPDPDFGFNGDDLAQALLNRPRHRQGVREEVQKGRVQEEDIDAQLRAHYGEAPPEGAEAWTPPEGLEARGAEDPARSWQGENGEILFQEAAVAGLPPHWAQDERRQARARELWEAQGVKSPFFVRWFAGSRVTDGEGKPRVVYHGTSRAGFDEFDTYASNYGLFGQGSYFTESPEIASTYTKKTARGQREEDTTPGVYPVYLRIQNALDMDAPANVNAWRQAAPDADFEGVKTNEDAYRALEEMVQGEGYTRWEGAEVMQDAIRAMGHDGITHMGGQRHGLSDGTKHRVWVALDPEQIKSATGNQGTFDAKSPNILYQADAPGRGGPLQSEVRTPTGIRNKLRTLVQNLGKLKNLAYGSHHLFLRPVGQAEAELVKRRTGVDVAGARHGVNPADLQHMLRSHGQEVDGSGQIPLTEADLLRIPDVLDGFDDVRRGKDNHGMPSLIYSKAFPDGKLQYVEVVKHRDGLKILDSKTMWKTPPPPSRPASGSLGNTAASGFPDGRQVAPNERGNPPNNLPQAGGERKLVKGSFEMEGQKAIITLFKGRADFSTWMHEHGHFLRRAALQGEDEKTIVQWLTQEGVTVLDAEGKWTREAEERFARAFERYLRDGKAPSESLSAVFEKIAKFMRRVYQSLKGTELEAAIPEHVRWVYDRLVSSGPTKGKEARAGEGKLFQGAKSSATPKIDAILANPSPAVAKSRAERIELAHANYKKGIDREGRKGETTSGWLNGWKRFYDRIWNQTEALEKVQEEYQKEFGIKLTDEQNIIYAVNDVLGAGGSAQAYLEKKLYPLLLGGEINGQKFDRLSPVELRLVEDYLIAKDTIWRYDHAPDFYNPIISRDDSEAKVEYHKGLPAAQRAKIEKHAAALIRYARELTARKVAAKLWTEEEFERIAKDPHYIPMIRNFAAVTNKPIGKSASKSFTSTNKLLRGTYALEDGEAPLFDPIASLIRDTQDVALETAKASVSNLVIDLVASSPNLRDLIRRAPPGYVTDTAEGEFKVIRTRETHLTEEQQKFAEKYDKALLFEKLEKNTKQAEGERRHFIETMRTRIYRSKGKVRESAEEYEEMIRKINVHYEKGKQKRREKAEETLVDFRKKPAEERRLIEDWLDEGRVQTYVVPKELADAINGMGPLELAIWMKPIVKTANIFRAGTTALNPFFSLSNIPRDMATAWVTEGMLPHRALIGLYHYVFKTPTFYEFLEAGGSQEGAITGMHGAIDHASKARYGTRFLRDRYKKMLDSAHWKEKKIVALGKEMSYGELARLGEGAKQTLTIVPDMALAFGKAGEMATRLGVFTMNAEKLSARARAAKARDATLNFQRHGSARMKELNAMIPFLNASLQGVDRIARALFTGEPKDRVAAAIRLMVAAALPGAALLAWNSQNEYYKDIPSWEKEYYWIFMLGKDTPKYAKVAKAHEVQMVWNPFQMIFENNLETARKDPWAIASSVLAAAVPVDDVGGATTPLLKIPIELEANKNLYFNREIVKEEGAELENQYDQRTFETAKTIARGMGFLPDVRGFKWAQSPAKLQHVAMSLGGGTATNILSALDYVLGKSGLQAEKEIDVGFNPLVNRLYGETQEWKADLHYRRRELFKQIKAKEGAIGSYRGKFRLAAEKGTLQEAMAQMQSEIRKEQDALKDLRKEIAAVNKAISEVQKVRDGLENRAK